MPESRNHCCRVPPISPAGHTALKSGPGAIELVDTHITAQRLGAAENKERQVMTKPLQHVSRRCAGFPLSAILVGPHRCDRKPGLTLSNRRVIHGLVKRSGDQATGEPGCAGRHRPCMKFRFVLLDPDGDSHRHTPPRENAAAAESADPAQAFRYQIRGTDMVRQERLADGRHRLIPVANFRACIVSDIILDDGVEQQRHCGVEAELDGQKVVFTVPAVEFGRMGWVLPRLGPRAIIYPGQTQHARAAIQELSGPIRQERIFSHLGWRKPDLDWVYLHAGGALGAAGLRSDWQVQLPAPLQDYRLQVPPQADELARAIQASLDLLRAAKDRVSFPLLAAVYRAALGGVSFSVFLSGPSGVFKSALAALCQQHFGAAMEASRLPANFASTGNALELLAFSAKDALLVVDDFAPQGGTGDGELHNVADRLFRGAGNQQGRGRLGANGRLRAAQAPRGLVLGTGEEVPQGQSIRARLVILELGAGEVDRGWLSRCQQAGRDGRLAASMGGFVRWVAGQYEGLQRRLHQRVVQIRSQSCGDWGHARTPAAMAELQAPSASPCPGSGTATRTSRRPVQQVSAGSGGAATAGSVPALPVIPGSSGRGFARPGWGPTGTGLECGAGPNPPAWRRSVPARPVRRNGNRMPSPVLPDRKSTRLNSSHLGISYA